MRLISATLGLCLALGAAQAQAQQTLDTVKKRGVLECGVHLGLPGFSFADDKGAWTGIDVDFCKALAAAVLGDATKVKYTPTSVQQRWAVLTSGQVDLLARNSTITFSRDASLGLNFTGINFYEGQTFIVRKKLAITSPAKMDGATVCVAAGSTVHIFRQNTRPRMPKGSSTMGQYDQLTLAALPITNDCSALPA